MSEKQGNPYPMAAGNQVEVLHCLQQGGLLADLACVSCGFSQKLQLHNWALYASHDVNWGVSLQLAAVN